MIAAGATVVAVLLKFLGKFDWGVVGYGWTGAIALAAFIGLFTGHPTPLRRWLSLLAVVAAGTLAAAYLGFSEKLPILNVIIFGWLPFVLIMLGAVIWTK